MATITDSMQSPVISFILPVYNSQNSLRNCVSQLLEIDDFTKEIILIDDGSTDQSGIICDEFTAQDSCIRCIHQTNQGVSAARNNGLELAIGQYIQFIDNDDTVEIHQLTGILKQLISHPEVDMGVFGLSFDYYHTGALYRRDDIPPAIRGIYSANEWIGEIPALYQSNALSPVWNKIIKRNILTENSLQLRKDMFLYEDLEYSIRCMADCNQIWFFDDIVYHYRQSEDEGNAGRRLLRIAHIPELMLPIEAAFSKLYDTHYCTTSERDSRHIINSLYAVLAREKINVSSCKEIDMICQDYCSWRQLHPELEDEENDSFTDMLQNKQTMALICQRFYIRYRHKLAVSVKSLKAGIERK